jgi:hypothetical protein
VELFTGIEGVSSQPVRAGRIRRWTGARWHVGAEDNLLRERAATETDNPGVRRALLIELGLAAAR